MHCWFTRTSCYMFTLIDWLIYWLDLIYWSVDWWRYCAGCNATRTHSRQRTITELHSWWESMYILWTKDSLSSNSWSRSYRGLHNTFVAGTSHSWRSRSQLFSSSFGNAYAVTHEQFLYRVFMVKIQFYLMLIGNPVLTTVKLSVRPSLSQLTLSARHKLASRNFHHWTAQRLVLVFQKYERVHPKRGR